MASFQRLALFIIFDSMERDLVRSVREIAGPNLQLTDDETRTAMVALSKRQSHGYNLESPDDLLYGLNLGQKFDVLLRYKANMDQASKDYFMSMADTVRRIIPVRNDVMHGRSVTVQEHVIGLAFAQELIGKPKFRPELSKEYRLYADDPASVVSRAIEFIDDPDYQEVPNNLPVPDFDDTGFVPRPQLERDLKQKILARNPVVTVLGEGGNGKTALTLQVLYGMVWSSDHDFDRIIWITAKTSRLTESGIAEIEGVLTSAGDIIADLVEGEPGEGRPIDRLRALMAHKKILLVVDNYETIQGDEFEELALDVPGMSKIVFTSRLPVEGSIPVRVDAMPEGDARQFMHRLVAAYSVESLKDVPEDWKLRHLRRLNFKPLLIKWFVLGVLAGLEAEAITQNPSIALSFCLDNVIGKLGPQAQAVIVVLTTLPESAAASVVRFVSRLKPQDVRDGIAELSRFSLLESGISEAGERTFSVRPFAQSYIQRIISPPQAQVDKILQRYRDAKSDYQVSRAVASRNPYAIENYDIRTFSQYCIVEMLDEASRAIRADNSELASQVIFECKLLDPEYYEIHRAEALFFVATNNWSAAVTCYETSLELEENSPKLHFFFAGLLMRLGDNERAATHFDRAMELDPEQLGVCREASRNQMMLYNFEKAQAYLDRCCSDELFGKKEKRILADLQFQIHIRAIDYHLRCEDEKLAFAATDCLLDLIAVTPANTMDFRMALHVCKVRHSISGLRSAGYDLAKLARIESAILSVSEHHKISLGTYTRETPPTLAGEFVGWVKLPLPDAMYGFLVSRAIDRDVMVHSRAVDSEVWEQMLQGVRVRFDVEDHPTGYRACNVSVFVDDMGQDDIIGEGPMA